MKYTVISTNFGLLTDFTMTFEEAEAVIAMFKEVNADVGMCWIVSNDQV